MTDTTRIRVLIHCRSAGADLFRTLVSLACQSVGPQRMNILLTSTAPQQHNSLEARLLQNSLGFKSVQVQDATGLHPAMALNIAALGGQEEALALVPEGSRLSPRFMASNLRTLEAKQAKAAYPMHTAGTPDDMPLIRLRPFSKEQLTRFNPVGPAALVLREAWQSLGGLRPGVQLTMWDFWLRLALSGGDIVRVPELLAFCRPLHKLPPWQDGQAKALLVVASPGAFEPDVCRWALAHLRGDAWAVSFTPGVIPSPRDVQAMFATAPTVLRPRPLNWNGGSIRTA